MPTKEEEATARAERIQKGKLEFVRAVDELGEKLRKPKWDYWRQIVEVDTWQAIALSCGIEPDEIVHGSTWGGLARTGQGYLSSLADSPMEAALYHLDSRCPEFFRIVASHCKAGNLGPKSNKPGVCTPVILSLFANWATKMQWEIPHELSKFGETKPPVKSESLSTTERATVLKIIAGFLAQGFKPDDIAKPYAVAKEVQQALDSSGIALSDDTIANWIKQAAPLLKPTQKKP